MGSKAQHKDYRKVAGSLKLAYAQFEELEKFAQFGTRLDESTKVQLEHGKRIRACLKQGEHDLVTVDAQIALLQALGDGKFDEVPLADMYEAEQQLYSELKTVSSNG